jgi:hypothetical protein
MSGEAMIRGIHGDEAALGDLDRDDVQRVQVLIAYGVTRELGLSGEDYERFLVQAADAAEDVAGRSER